MKIKSNKLVPIIVGACVVVVLIVLSFLPFGDDCAKPASCAINGSACEKCIDARRSFWDRIILKIIGLGGIWV
ncbi:hypothetical protein FWF74_03040 [Candidatus Saccharibacteria bacterium]|nr:hypothetical protein [Candidatus Saccharibacteria bacterium]MCL1962930.1 hypothetical protein [Candidatus Saccharibacteria bacterium]